jgi:hypothetical protein
VLHSFEGHGSELYSAIIIVGLSNLQAILRPVTSKFAGIFYLGKPRPDSLLVRISPHVLSQRGQVGPPPNSFKSTPCLQCSSVPFICESTYWTSFLLPFKYFIYFCSLTLEKGFFAMFVLCSWSSFRSISNPLSCARYLMYILHIGTYLIVYHRQVRRKVSTKL